MSAPPLPRGPFKARELHPTPAITPRTLPPVVVSMATLAARAEMVRLADCEAWTTGGWDIIRLPDGRWAAGFWCDGTYAPAWTDHALRLAEVPAGVAAGICDRCGTDYPPALVEAMAAPAPVEPAATPAGDPASRAVAAAYALRKAGRPVSVRAACKAARVDRNHLAKRHPETVKLIEQLAEPDRAPLRGAIDRRAGNLDAWDEG